MSKLPYWKVELKRARRENHGSLVGSGRNSHKKLLWVFQRGLCCFCGCKMRISRVRSGNKVPENTATVEHLHPRCYGGSTGLHNKALACHKCNTTRGHVCWIEFKSVMMGELHHMPLWKPKVVERVINAENEATI